MVTSWLDALPRDASPGGGLLAGPILRRASPDAVAVWLATAGPTRVTGRVFDTKNTTLGRGEAQSRSFGAHLHLTLVDMVPTIDQYPTDQLLHYDLQLTVGTGVETRTYRLGDYTPQRPPSGTAFAYKGLPAPTFHLPRSAPVRFLHGSCRKLHGKGDDALALADDIIAARDVMSGRPAALFLTGDQIYADDIADVLFHPMADLARWLLGSDEVLPIAGPLSSRQPFSWAWLFARVFRPDHGNDPYKSSARNHAAGLGEFAALYLWALGDALWPPDLRVWRENWTGGADDPVRRPQIQALEAFRASVPRVRRALANVPTYMILDDHEVTDDWNLDRDIHESAERGEFSAFGKRVIANALTGYLLFQGWGNTPERADDLVGRVGDLLASGDRASLDDTMLTAPSWGYVTPTIPPVVVMDTRTRRDFIGPDHVVAGLLRDDALRQLSTDLADAREVAADQPVVVVSAAPVFGIDWVEDRQRAAGWAARYEYDAEFWSANPVVFDRLLDVIMANVKRVVFLSGDVHYGFVKKVWLSAPDGRSVEVVQFTSSALRNDAAVLSGLIDLPGLINILSPALASRVVVLTQGRTQLINPDDPKQRRALTQGTVKHSITSLVTPPVLHSEGLVIGPRNLGELLFSPVLQCRLYTPDRGATGPLEMAVDPFGPRPEILQKPPPPSLLDKVQIDRVAPILLAQAGAGITQPALPTLSLNDDERASVAAARRMRTDPTLRAIAAGFPLRLLVGWIDVESGGVFNKVEPGSGESGYFQIDRGTMIDNFHITVEQVIATPQSSLLWGLKLVRLCSEQVDRWTTNVGVELADDDTHQALTKLYHTVGAGSFVALLRAATPHLESPLSWPGLKAWWQPHAATIPGSATIRSKLRQWQRMTGNVDKVLKEGTKLAPAVQASTPAAH